MEQLYFDQWRALSTEEKNNLMSHILKTQGFPFQIMGTNTFELNNIQVETVIFEYNNDDGVPKDEKAQFVFVPGQKNITLGWTRGTCGVGKEVESYLKESFAEQYAYDQSEQQETIQYYQDEIEKAKKNNNLELIKELEEVFESVPTLKTFDQWLSYVDSVTSPVRTVDIQPMIVEVCPRRASDIDGKKEDCFDIPTVAEWEYLCGAGNRTLFPWGDFLEAPLVAIYGSFMSSGLQEHFAVDTSFLEQPNMFGLFIMPDGYGCEIVDAPTSIKGGDGGCAICGGEGNFYIAPMLSNFYIYDEDTSKRRIANKHHRIRRLLRIDL